MTAHQVVPFLLDVALILVVARVLAGVAKRLRQPPVIGELVAGILLGPTLFHGAISTALFPTDVRPYLSALANLGLAIFMFIVGLELDHNLLRSKTRTAVSVSIGSIVLPFGLGAVLALYLLTNHPAQHQLGFVLFMGAAMSVTAFPVLARILSDRNLNRTELGGLAMTCAAVDDVAAWSLLAVVVAVTSGGGPEQWRMLLVVPYLAIMFGVVRPLLRRVLTGDKLTTSMLTFLLVGLMVSAATTEWVGLHFIFGAFLFGAIVPQAGTEALREAALDRIGQVSAVLLPVFFVIAGLRVDLSGMGAVGVLELTLILLVAVGGKFGGAFLGARLHGTPARESAALATLMNTRGLTELVILSVGLQLGVLDESLYSLMVVMALVTTVMAGPLLELIHPAPAVHIPVQARSERAPVRS